LNDLNFMPPVYQAPSLVTSVSATPEEAEALLIRVYEKPTAAWETITPELAIRYLETMDRNRPEKAGGIDAYARDMENDDWMLTGETIVFDWFGRLIDGQHRLRGIIRSKKTIVVLVVRGIDPKAQDRMDSGIKRSFSDTLSMEGYLAAPVVSATLRRIHLWGPPFNERVNFSRITVTKAELEKVLRSNPEIPDIVTYISPLAPRVEVSKSLLSFLFWLFAQKNQDAAVAFMDKWASGTNLDEGDAVLTLIRRLRKERRNAEKNGSRAALQTLTLWLAVYAWNASRRGKPISNLQLPGGGIKAENFPRILD
jgi:hypothetical protein